MPHLDRDSKVERAAAHRTPVALPRLPQIGEPRLVITSRFDAAEMPPVAIGSSDELSFAQCLVGDDLTREPNRAQRTTARAEGCLDLLIGRRARVPR